MKALYTFILAVLSVLVLGPLALIGGGAYCLLTWRWPHKGYINPVGRVIRKIWADFLLKAHGVELEISGPGLAKLKQMEACVIVSNHQSALDILIYLSLMNHKVAFLAKKELLGIPLFGWAAWISGTVYIDRKRGASHRESIEVVEATIRKGGSVLIYPEGTRSSDASLLPFKRGAFVTAIELSVPILPICIRNSGQLMPKKAATIKSGRVQIRIGEPISTMGLGRDDRFSLAEKVRQAIANELV